MSVIHLDNHSSARFDNANMAAHAYLDLGFDPIPIPAREKQAKCRWGESFVTRANVDLLIPATGNVAVALGSRSNGLIDFDFDNPKAVEIAELLTGIDIMPDGPVFGRNSNPSSHRLFRCPVPGRHWDSDLPKGLLALMGATKSKIVEVRGNGCYTVMPGSVHKDTGERIVFETFDLIPPDISWTDAIRLGGLISFLTVVAATYPDEGRRNDTCLALAGALVSAGYSALDTDKIVTAIAQHAGDTEADSRRFGERSESRLKSGVPVVGLARLCEELGLSDYQRDLRGWLFATDSEFTRPTIMVVSGKLSDAVDKAEDTLISAGVSIFQRGGDLVRPCRLDARRVVHGTTEEATASLPAATGPLVLTPVTEIWLLDQLSRIVRWRKPDRKTGEPIAIEPPLDVAKRLLSRRGDWKFPVIRGVIEAPTLRQDRTLLQDEGYDERSGLYFDSGGASFIRVNDEPTKEDAMAALARLVRLFRCFPFQPDELADDWRPATEEGLNPSASRSVVLSAVLTGLVRRSLRTAPLHGIDAPTRGSGKTLIADLVSTILTGRTARVIAWSGDEAEDEKRLYAALLQGDAGIYIDNVEHPLESSALCVVTTSSEWNNRVLKESKNVSVSTSALVMATGNNLTFKGDMTRRSVVARIDPRAERPQERTFTFDAREYAVQMRTAFVADGLIILRAYAVAGYPLQGSIKNVGSFEDWSFVREALAWLDQPDPADTMRNVQENDPEREELSEVMSVWHDAFGGKTVTVRDALDYALEGMTAFSASDDPAERRLKRRLYAAFEQVSYNGKVNARSLGHWFKRKLGKPVGGLSFERAGKNANKTQLIVLRGGEKF